MLNVPMAKHEGVVEPLKFCQIDSDGIVLKCKRVMHWLNCPQGGASKYVGVYTPPPLYYRQCAQIITNLVEKTNC